MIFIQHSIEIKKREELAMDEIEKLRTKRGRRNIVAVEMLMITIWIIAGIIINAVNANIIDANHRNQYHSSSSIFLPEDSQKYKYNYFGCSSVLPVCEIDYRLKKIPVELLRSRSCILSAHRKCRNVFINKRTCLRNHYSICMGSKGNFNFIINSLFYTIIFNFW